MTDWVPLSEFDANKKVADDFRATYDPFTQDCWACASEAARRLFAATGRRTVSFAMYLCPECGNKRCAKATDHLRECDKGAGAEYEQSLRDDLQNRQSQVAYLRALRAAADALYTDFNSPIVRSAHELYHNGYDRAMSVVNALIEEVENG